MFTFYNSDQKIKKWVYAFLGIIVADSLANFNGEESIWSKTEPPPALSLPLFSCGSMLSQFVWRINLVKTEPPPSLSPSPSFLLWINALSVRLRRRREAAQRKRSSAGDERLAKRTGGRKDRLGFVFVWGGEKKEKRRSREHNRSISSSESDDPAGEIWAARVCHRSRSSKEKRRRRDGEGEQE